MSKKESESAVGDEHTAFSKIEDANSGHGGSPTATSGSKMRQRKPKKKNQEKCKAITAALPADIVGDVLKRMNPKEAVRLSSVCRHWRAPALACNPTLRPTPWMLELTQSENRLHFRLQSVADASIFVEPSPVNVSPGTALFLVGSWHDWLLLSEIGPADDHFLFLNPFSRVRIDLPLYPDLYNVLCITSDPAEPGCAIIAHNLYNLMVCRPGDGFWTEGVGVCRIGRFSLAVWLKEQLFFLDPIRRRLLTLQLFPLRCKDHVPVSFCQGLGCMNLYLVESEGDLLVFDTGHALTSMNKSCELIRAFRLDWDTMAFLEVESLGTDRAVFLAGIGQSISVSAVEAGCVADCIYFQNIKGFESNGQISWHCYNLQKRTCECVLNRHTYKPTEFRGQRWITPMKNNYS